MNDVGLINRRVEAAMPPLRHSVDARCPHLVFRDVLGAQYVAGLLNYVADRQSDFQPGPMRNRKTGQLFVDPKFRDCLYLKDLGPFAGPIKSFVTAIAAPALDALHVIEPAVEPMEFEITAYGDGGHIGEHIDTRRGTDRARVLSCVYYFAATPRRFSGGELRFYGFPQKSAVAGEPSLPSCVDVEPHTDTLVVFPSWLRHKVLPVRIPSGAWADRRFAINCWVLRAGSPSGLETAAAGAANRKY